MKISLFYLPSIGSRAEIKKGMAGLRGDLYDRMLAEVSEQARLADDLGYDSISFTEHHFHIEGFELSNNPVLLDLFVGMQTKNIRVGQLGIVLPSRNPIRVAEDIAMLDYDGRFWKVPVGGAEGGTPWALEATEQWGAGVEDGVLRQVGVVPKPVQKPHPPIFQPFASSEASIRWCAREDVTAILPPLHPKRERALFELFAEESGRPLGEGIGVLRDVVIADTDTEAERLWKASGAFCGAAWFDPFGFSRGMADPDTGEEFDDMMGSGMALVGTVDTVTRQLKTLQERLPVTWLYFWAYNGLLPHARLMSTIERFANEVLPRVA